MEVLAAGLALAAVLAQISYPLLTGATLRLSTVAAVVLFAAAGLVHAAAALGPPAAARLLLVAGGTGLVAEAVGVATGLPFGRYRYGDTLGPALLGVPIVVPLAWTMMAYPCLLLGRRLARPVHPDLPDRPDLPDLPDRSGTGRRTRTVITGAGTLVAWDLFLDPQMVAAGHWRWDFPDPHLPGVPDVPLTNYAGWLLVAVVMIMLLDRALPPRVPAARTGREPGEAVPAALLAWTWLGSAFGNLVFFGRPAVAVYGLLAMGAGVLPYLLALRRTAAWPPPGPAPSEPSRAPGPSLASRTSSVARTSSVSRASSVASWSAPDRAGSGSESGSGSGSGSGLGAGERMVR